MAIDSQKKFWVPVSCRCGGHARRVTQTEVIEADKILDVNRPATEFVCLHCGRRFYFNTKRYIKVLDALGVDYTSRLP